MYEEFFKNGNVSADRLLAPARKLNSLVIEGVEKVTTLQIEAAKGYADLTVKHIRNGLGFSDQKGLQDYLSNHGELLKSFSEQLQSDTQALASIGQDFGQELQGLLRENVNVFAAAPKTATKKSGASAAARKSA